MESSRQLNASATIESLVGHADDVLLFDKAFDGFLPPLLTIPEVAKILKISEVGVRRLQQQRDIPFFKVGGSIRFSQNDLASYLQERRVETIK